MSESLKDRCATAGPPSPRMGKNSPHRSKMSLHLREQNGGPGVAREGLPPKRRRPGARSQSPGSSSWPFILMPYVRIFVRRVLRSMPRNCAVLFMWQLKCLRAFSM